MTDIPVDRTTLEAAEAAMKTVKEQHGEETEMRVRAVIALVAGIKHIQDGVNDDDLLQWAQLIENSIRYLSPPDPMATALQSLPKDSFLREVMSK